ncbi:7905_t:CDS:1, partial [Scutellospora calospora]
RHQRTPLPTNLLVQPILRSIRNLERLGHALASLRRLSTSGVQPINLLKHLPIIRLSIKSQPRHRSIPRIIRPRNRCIRRGSRVALLERAIAVSVSARIEVEERRLVVGEVVVAGHALVERGIEVGGVGDWEIEGDGADAGEQVGHVCCEAGDVEKGCYGSCGDGRGGAVAEVAGVILGAAADGDVAQGEAFCWGWEWDGCCVGVLVGVGDGN